MSKGNGAGSTLLRMLQKKGGGGDSEEGQYLELWQPPLHLPALKQTCCRSQYRTLQYQQLVHGTFTIVKSWDTDSNTFGKTVPAWQTPALTFKLEKL